MWFLGTWESLYDFACFCSICLVNDKVYECLVSDVYTLYSHIAFCGYFPLTIDILKNFLFPHTSYEMSDLTHSLVRFDCLNHIHALKRTLQKHLVASSNGVWRAVLCALKLWVVLLEFFWALCSVLMCFAQVRFQLLCIWHAAQKATGRVGRVFKKEESADCLFNSL